MQVLFFRCMLFITRSLKWEFLQFECVDEISRSNRNVEQKASNDEIKKLKVIFQLNETHIHLFSYALESFTETVTIISVSGQRKTQIFALEKLLSPRLNNEKGCSCIITFYIVAGALTKKFSCYRTLKYILLFITDKMRILTFY